MQQLFILILGGVAGLHAACYGAYKDSPYETFKLTRFIREIAIGGFSALLVLLFTRSINSIHLAVLFLSFLACSRIITESYKLFIRIEPQEIYKIPSMVHVFRTVPTSRFQRIAIALLLFIVLVLAAALAILIHSSFPRHVSGAIIGLLIGSLTGFGGAYKDGFFEGFDPRKFFRSPTIGTMSGFFLSYLTDRPIFLFLAACGLERMVVEFYKGFVKAKYVPGKFKFTKARYPEYFTKRKQLILPYAVTWIIFLALVFWRH